MIEPVTVTLSNHLSERVRRVAQQRGQDIIAIVEEILDENLPAADIEQDRVDLSEPDEAMDREIAAYHQLHPLLWQKYPKQYVAIQGGQLIDYDQDRVALSRRIRERLPDQFVLLRQVEPEPERTLYFRSFRIVKDQP